MGCAKAEEVSLSLLMLEISFPVADHTILAALKLARPIASLPIKPLQRVTHYAFNAL
jgi:hypothetical protein